MLYLVLEPHYDFLEPDFLIKFILVGFTDNTKMYVQTPPKNKPSLSYIGLLKKYNMGSILCNKAKICFIFDIVSR